MVVTEGAHGNAVGGSIVGRGVLGVVSAHCVLQGGAGVLRWWRTEKNEEWLPCVCVPPVLRLQRASPTTGYPLCVRLLAGTRQGCW